MSTLVLGTWLKAHEERPAPVGSAAAVIDNPGDAGSPTPAVEDIAVVDTPAFRAFRRRTVIEGGVPFSFKVPTRLGWERFNSRPTTRSPAGPISLNRSITGPQGAEIMIYWTSYPDGDHADPCGRVLDSPIGPTAADLAAAVSTAPGTELVSGPSDVTLGGRPAKHVVLTVRAHLGCDPGFFFGWRDRNGGALWSTTGVGATIRVWIVDVHGTRLFIAAATTPEAAGLNDLEGQIQRIVGSFRSERPSIPGSSGTDDITRTVAGVRFSLRVPTAAWADGPVTSSPDGELRAGRLLISQSTMGSQGAEAVIYWTSVGGGPRAEPCGQWWGSPVGSVAESAANASRMRGTELAKGPVDVTLDGYAAKHVVLVVRQDLGCDPGYFYAWRGECWGPCWVETDVGDTIRVWIVDVKGTRLFIAAETTRIAGAQLEREIRQIIASIRFE